MGRPDLMIVGLGGVGAWLMELAARDCRFSRIVGTGRDVRNGRKRVASAKTGAALQDLHPQIDFLQMDLLDEEKTAEALQACQPRIIVNCTTVLSWWIINRARPEDTRRLLEAEFGPWLPVHIVLARKLMSAVEKSGIDTKVVNASFPDVVNPVLAKVGMAPVCGLGNIDLMIHEVKPVVAERLGISTADVNLYMVLHHYHAKSFYSKPNPPSPYYLKILACGDDYSNEWDKNSLLHEAALRRMEGQDINSVTASSGIRIIASLMEANNRLVHVPAPNGLPGGYPTRVTPDGLKISLPTDISFETALSMNLEAQRNDGVERIEPDGTVIFTEKSAGIMREVLGYDCPELKPDEHWDRAMELRRLVEGLVNQNKGV